MNIRKSYVVDEKGIVAFLKGESSASYLISLFKEAESGKVAIFIPISAYGYIYSWAQKEGYRLIKIHDILSSLPLIIYNFDRDFIDKTVNFNELHLEYSMGQAILLTLAKEKSATIVTADKSLKTDDPTISINWV
ncbi:MAG: hypothetical protein ABIH38_03960 [Patescibacteria group bacterium]